MKAEVINCPNPAIEIAAEPAAGKKTDRDVPVNTDKRNDKALRMTENKFEKSNFKRNCTNPVWHGVGAYSGGAAFWNIICHLNLACGYSDGDSYWSSDRTFDSGFPRGGSAAEAV